MNDDERKMLHDIHRALVGEKQFKREGIIAMVQRHDRWIANAKVRIAAIVGGCTVVVWILDKVWK